MSLQTDEVVQHQQEMRKARSAPARAVRGDQGGVARCMMWGKQESASISEMGRKEKIAEGR